MPIRIPGADKAVDNLIRWSANDEWTPHREQVFAEHFDMICERFATTPAQLAELLGDAFSTVFSCVLEDFFTARFGDEDANVIDDYLKRRGWREKVPAKRYLEALRDSVLSFYEVVDLKPGQSITVKDLIRGGDPITVGDKLGSESAARWDRIAARVVTVNGKAYFTGSLLLFPYEAADELVADFLAMVKRAKRKVQAEAKKLGELSGFDVDAIRAMLLATSARLFTRTWLIDALHRAAEPMPEIRNTDGDQIVFSEVRFPITGEVSEIIARLNGIREIERDAPGEMRWSWHGRGSPFQRMPQRQALALRTEDEAGRTLLGTIEIRKSALILSTNSRERAERGRALLASDVVGLVGQPLTAHQDLERVLEERPDTPSHEPDLPPEVAEQAIHQILNRHYRQVFDEPVPYLDGKSPRQAAKTKSGRELVIGWLKKLENAEGRRAASQGQRPYDFGWMWREMKIDR